MVADCATRYTTDIGPLDTHTISSGPSGTEAFAMSTTDRESASSLPAAMSSSGLTADGLQTPVRAVSDEAIWLDGDVLSCACPDCRAPMSIRLWLRVADCWRCGASIELTEAQHRKALDLLRQRQQSPPPSAPAKVQTAPAPLPTATPASVAPPAAQPQVARLVAPPSPP